MQLKNLIFAAATAAALPATDAATNEPFGVISIHSGSGVQYAPFNAALGSIFAGLKSQNASCSNPQDQTATFFLDDGALYLYDQSATPQELYVDRSGMGQGKIGYTTGAQPAPKNGERKGWSIDANNHLQFGGKDLIACPNSIEGAWSIWADAGVAKPGYNEGCEGIAARVEVSKNPNVCSYTSN
ncbi:hypothetical protein CBS63078_3808 [Aspergillus niger]|uniref:Cell wall protein PhiA n=2 Tax=Aspergillus TaxID=5052 RepID=A0A370PEQ4_ASPPH|nr:uncharacterized protein BO96DRAFT_414494 [Aspergillus niger CBS 101883]KAI2886179.1 hypothetical protein CBS13152_7186 [Aspergillus niger]RDK40667.1 hypothetical protein M752DRAFT_337176 [Aspergillus phoenicis ATCC 13157]KAI2913169.1 hypothetical protein CBS63078_3808 [Aspergillus niger]KAI2964554.1 hypothetical protein CBS147323_6253 [Aspergillus niger]KAI3019721.1 hypothetical protein CBS147345_3964 [Aspergillus niger]